MIYPKRQLTLKLFQISDLVFLLLSFLVARYAISRPVEIMSLDQFLSMRVKVQDFMLFALFILVWHAVFVAFGLYRSGPISRRWGEFSVVIRATSTGTLLLIFMDKLFDTSLFTPLFVAEFMIAANSSILLNRLLFKYVYVKVRMHGRMLRHILIVGTNRRAIRFARNLDDRPDMSYHIVGFVESEWADNRDFRNTEFRKVTNFEGLPDFLRKNIVDEVMICLPIKSFYNKYSEIVGMCEEQGIVVRLLSDFFDLKTAKATTACRDHGAPLTCHDEGTLMTIESRTMKGWAMGVKRAMDIAVSFVMLSVLSPLLLMVALMIKRDSPGPVLFVQDRIGMNKRRFRLYKFRTMVSDAEERIAGLEQFNEMSGPVFKIKHDPRITWIGRYLRKFSIDELPQLINVLKGDMSLVGPRPLPVRDHDGFNEDWQRRRFSVQPGITCLWQVNGRNNIPFDEWMKLDMMYIDNWSLGLDFKILLATIPAVFTGSGAT